MNEATNTTRKDNNNEPSFNDIIDIATADCGRR